VKFLAPLALTILVVSGCVSEPITTSWRDGAPVSQVSEAQTNCQVEALNKVPSALSTTTTPVYRAPSNVQCTTYGNYTNCHDYGGQVYGGNQVTEDVNASLRAQVTKQCLAKKGISVISFPACTNEEKKGRVISSRTGRLPPAANVLCLADEGYVLR
jgi:hypothetical protein